VKTFFGTSAPATGSNTESNTQSLDFPLTIVNDIAGEERRRNLYIIVKVKLEQLRSVRLILRDLRATKLDM
jgi:hypothetical protein